MPAEQRFLEVVDPGALATVQDLGRAGLAHLGVPRSGALDEPAHRLANRLVGNPEGAATVEVTLTGARFRVSRACTVAVTGAWCEVRSGARALAWGAPVTLSAGASLALGPARDGLRCHLAVAGGVAVEPVLGSRSTDLLSGLGPAPLRGGDRLPLGPPHGVPRPVDAAEPSRSALELRVLPGPRDDWFDPAALAALDGSSYSVTSDSNRVGLRLRGPSVRRRDDRELPSEGLVLGAVQVPADGQPVVFLADHPTTGGYPVVGVVAAADLPGCAQLRPGDTVTLRLVSPGRAGRDAAPGRQPRG